MPATGAMMASKVKDKDRQSNKDKEDALAALEMAQQAHDRFNSPEHRQKWLDTHDTNKSGVFERDEFEALFLDLSKDLIPEITGDALHVPHEIVDKLYGGKEGLTVDELYQAMKRTISFVKSQARLHNLFHSVDADANGYLNKAELGVLLQKGAPPKYNVGEADVEFVLQKCDIDGDQHISLVELGPAVAVWMEIAKDLKTLPAADAEGGTGSDGSAKKSSMCVLL